MSENDGYVAKCEDVSFGSFLPEYAAGLSYGLRK